MNKNKKHISFYLRNMETGMLPFCGLCNCAEKRLISKKLLNLFSPDFSDMGELRSRNLSTVFWGANLPDNVANIGDLFTPLRQTIVLFMAAKNGEL